MDTLTGISEIRDGSFDRFLTGELVKPLVGNSSEPLGSIGLVVADQRVELLDVDVDLLGIGQEGDVLPRALVVPSAVVDVVLLGILGEIGIVSQVEDLSPCDEPTIMVNERDIVSLDVPPSAVY